MGSTALWASTARTSLAAAPWADQARRDRIAKVIREFDSQGDHRTGTPVDQESGRWLSDWVRGAGVEPEAERLPFSKIDMLHTYVEVGDRWAEGVPLFDGAFTDADGVTGVLGGIDDDGAIGVTRAGPRPGADFSRYRGTTRQRAVIAITGGAQSGVPDGIALMNAPAYTEPFGPVGLQVATHEGPWLEAAAQRRAEARLVAHVDRRQVEVFNVVATVEGREPAIDPLVVMTPRSGWWTCASERGGGIAVWLEMLRALHVVRPRRSSIFVASTGHELGHVGLDHFLKRRRALIRSAVAWIHLGANFGTAIGGHRVFKRRMTPFSSSLSTRWTPLVSAPIACIRSGRHRWARPGTFTMAGDGISRCSGATASFIIRTTGGRWPLMSEEWRVLPTRSSTSPYG